VATLGPEVPGRRRQPILVIGRVSLLYYLEKIALPTARAGSFADDPLGSYAARPCWNLAKRDLR
jgi:hypothetical protein